MKRRLDLTGQRFGRLTVLRPAENIGGKPAWVCRCDCGEEAIVKDYHLRYGQTRSCGCLHRKSKENPLGLTFVDGTCVELLTAKTARKNSTSGVRGVYWMSGKRVWRASICFKGKRQYLGLYRNLEDAVKARKRAEEELFEPFLHEFAGEKPLSSEVD